MRLIEVCSIILDCKDHVACTIGDAIVWIRGNIFEDLVDSVSIGFGGRGFLGANDAESNKKFAVDRASVPQEGAKNTLDALDAVRVEWRELIGICKLMGLGAVEDGGMLVWRELGVGGLWVAVSGKEFFDVAWRGYTTSEFGLVPVKFHAGKFGTLPALSYDVVLLEDVV